MASQEQRRDRPELEERLRTDLKGQDHAWRTGNVEQFRELEARIQATANQVEPDDPQAAIFAARREVAYEDLGKLLGRRAEVPSDTASEALRIRSQYLDNKILDLARKLDPRDARRAIAHATPIARGYLVYQMDEVYPDPVHHMEVARPLIKDVSHRLGTMAAGPEPTQQQRVHETLIELSHLDCLHAESRKLAESRAALPHGGNIYELKRSLNALPDPRKELNSSAEGIFRHPARARRRLEASYRDNGEQVTLERFAQDPAVFGRLRGQRIPLVGNTRPRREALKTTENAQAAFQVRKKIAGSFNSAVELKVAQTENRDRIEALPDRESLLGDLGRHMEGLEMHEVQPLLQEGQGKLVEDVRRAEQRFLEPLRDASRRLGTLDAGKSVLPMPRAGLSEVGKASALLEGAPRHIIGRLSQPQMRSLWMATSMVRSAAMRLSRVASA